MPSPTPKTKTLSLLAKDSLKIEIELFPLCYFTWKLELFSNILSVVAAQTQFFVSSKCFIIKFVSFYSYLKYSTYRNLFQLVQQDHYSFYHYQLENCNFIKKETFAQVFSCKFCEILKNAFLSCITSSGRFCQCFNFISLVNTRKRWCFQEV